MENQSLRYFPIALFASVMGYAAVTIAIIHLESILNWNNIFSTIFIILTTIVFLINGGIFIYRLFSDFTGVKNDFNHPIKANFFGAISISLLLLAVIYSDLSYSLSFA